MSVYFKRFSSWLSKSAIYTLDKMIQMLHKCYHHCGSSAEEPDLEYVLNFCEWLTPHMNQLSKHSKPHVSV